MAGGGYVPLSRAMCCRLCLPKEFPPEFTSKLPAGVFPASIISVGCHSSTTTDLVTCEKSSNDFLTGFQSAVPVPTSATYYPEGPAICCTPVVILSNGASPRMCFSFTNSVACFTFDHSCGPSMTYPYGIAIPQPLLHVGLGVSSMPKVLRTAVVSRRLLGCCPRDCD